jgi:hypothetical protein
MRLQFIFFECSFAVLTAQKPQARATLAGDHPRLEVRLQHSQRFGHCALADGMQSEVGNGGLRREKTVRWKAL